MIRIKKIKWWSISYNTIIYWNEKENTQNCLNKNGWTSQIHLWAIKRPKTVYVNPFIWSSKMDKTNMYIFIYMEDSEFYKCSRNFLI